MLKIVTIIGARPQFIKAAAISRAIASRHHDQIHEVIVHTGQHYDKNMSRIFFDELGIPRPDHQLPDAIDKKGDALQSIKTSLHLILTQECPQAVLVYGDTLSTLAGAESASELNIPLIHVEAGLRSFNDQMPEEYNRVKTDQLSQLLFVPTAEGIKNLDTEGFPNNSMGQKVFLSGDIMYDNSLYFAAKVAHNTTFIDSLSLSPKFLLATVHRNINTDQVERLAGIFTALVKLAELGYEIVLPLHPRTKKMMKTLPLSLIDRIEASDNLKIIKPVSFLEIIILESNCAAVLTDSGGVQKEAFFFKKPCVILRDETEWTELVANGNSVLAGANPEKIISATQQLLSQTNYTFPEFYGNGHAAEIICDRIIQNIEC